MAVTILVFTLVIYGFGIAVSVYLYWLMHNTILKYETLAIIYIICLGLFGVLFLPKIVTYCLDEIVGYVNV